MSNVLCEIAKQKIYIWVSDVVAISLLLGFVWIVWIEKSSEKLSHFMGNFDERFSCAWHAYEILNRKYYDGKISVSVLSKTNLSLPVWSHQEATQNSAKETQKFWKEPKSSENELKISKK